MMVEALHSKRQRAGRTGKVSRYRGTVRTDTVDGLAPEYVAMIHRTLSKEDAQTNLTGSAALYPQQARIFIRPEWVGLHDFETRLPSAVERAIERTQAGAR